MSDASTIYPETLILEPGDDITAIYQRLESGHTRDGEKRAIAILELDGADRSLWLHETALRAQFRQCKPEPGETIRVRKGTEKTKGVNGYDYWPFKVTAPERPPEVIGWDSPLLGGDDQSHDEPGDAGPPDDIEFPDVSDQY